MESQHSTIPDNFFRLPHGARDSSSVSLEFLESGRGSAIRGSTESVWRNSLAIPP